MRLGQWISSSFVVCCLMLCTTGCVCVDRQGCSPYGSTCGSCPSNECSSCSTCESDCGGCGEACLGPGILAKLLACRSGSCGCSGGCGGLYVDEWINERPQVDNCGCDDGSNCGCHRPVRSLFGLLWGAERFYGGCETGCCDGVDLSQPLIQDGYDPHARRSSPGCNCASRSNGAAIQESATEGIESIDSPVGTPKTVPEVKSAPGDTNRMTPTPAPPIPKSAMRLNPAARKVNR